MYATVEAKKASCNREDISRTEGATDINSLNPKMRKKGRKYNAPIKF